jgi:hypothetical protein
VVKVQQSDGWTEIADSGEPAEREGSNGTDLITLFLPEPLKSTVVTICTASLTFNNSTFCPHSVFMCGLQNKQRLFHCTTLTL